MADVFDEEAALDRVEGDREFLKELLAVCLSDAASKWGVLTRVIEETNLAEASSMAHSLKSAFGNVGAMECHSLAASLERASKEGDVDGAKGEFLKLSSALERFRERAAQFSGS